MVYDFIKIGAGDAVYYIFWSPKVNGPISQGMTYEEFVIFYGFQYGDKAMEKLPTLLKRADETGCSIQDKTLDWLLRDAGLSRDQLISDLCPRRKRRRNGP